MKRTNDTETEMAGCGCGCVDRDRRRTVGLLAATGLAAVLPVGEAAAAGPAPAKAPPKAGDEFVFAKGDRKGQTVAVADLASDGAIVEAWAKDPASGTVRSGSKLHRVILVRVGTDGLDEKTKKRVAEGGIVAYSGFCTHAGCAIENFKPEEQVIVCHCHSSVFDPRANGKVVSGPAKRSLAGLPLKVEGERLLVAGEFEGKVGVPKAGA